MRRTGLACTVAVTVFAWLGGACNHSPSIPCDAKSCLGCCDSSGHCQLGDTAQRCGSGGASCAVCPPTQDCQGGACANKLPDAGQDGGVGCGLLSCTGCCDAHGQCRPGDEHFACGSFGGACAACNTSCGANHQSCVGGSCVGAPCGGCCQLVIDFCVENDTASHCGLPSGSFPGQCLSCGQGICDAGQCDWTPCGPANCPNSCCDAQGRCVLLFEQIYAGCGSGGTACQSCGQNYCTVMRDGGHCGNAAVGTPCMSDFDCQFSMGPTATCRVLPAALYRDGMCTIDCSDGGACPTGSACVRPGGFGEMAALCLASCKSDEDCRVVGYRCLKSDAGVPLGCWSDPNVGVMQGAPCSDDSNCASTFGPGTGYCILAALPDGGPSGYPGGACSADCTNAAIAGDGSNTYCDGSCVAGPARGGRTFFCAQPCNTPLAGQGVCRAGYVCTSGSDVPFCTPSCANPGAGCPSGYACIGDYCCDAGACLAGY